MPDLIKNFIRGAGSILELIPPARSRFDSQTRLRTTEEAMRADWQHVGDSLRNAMKSNLPKKPAHGTAQQT